MPDPFFKEIKELFTEAEDKLKTYERANTNLLIPAVNQLRYAGFHVVKYLNEKDVNKKKEHGQRAMRHCQRAIYDVSEAGILDVFEKVDKFKNDYKLIVISEVIFNYTELLVEIDNGRDFLKNLSNEDKENSYKESCGHCIRLNEISKLFEHSREDLNKKMYKNWRATKNTYTALAVSGLSIVVTAIIAVIIAVLQKMNIL